jgi:phage regulator Rha-like protein
MSVPERIESKILLLRGQKVMLDRDLAELYGVPTKNLKRAVQRNKSRFPDDFAFVLDNQEVAILRCQFGTSSSWGGVRYKPMAFTEQGVAMLSSVLNSERAVQVNIAIIRAFVRLRQLLASHEDLARMLAELEKKYDEQFRVVFDALRELMTPPAPAKKEIGFHVKEKRANYKTKSPSRKRTGAIP